MMFCMCLRAPKRSRSKQEKSHSSSGLLQLTASGWSLRGTGLATYFQQSVWPAALSLALLYLTVLSLGLLMTAYLKWQGMTEAVLSLYRGAGAVSGLLATVAFPPIHKVAGNVCSVHKLLQPPRGCRSCVLACVIGQNLLAVLAVVAFQFVSTETTSCTELLIGHC